MIELPLESITADTLAALVECHAEETRTLDFKQALPRDLDELAADVCALANSAGGDLVIGIAEEVVKRKRTGRAGALVGLDSAERDATLLRLENTLRDTLQPSLPPSHRQIQPVPLPDGRYALVIRVTPSLNAPHRVRPSGGSPRGHFYVRHSSGNEPMDLDTLRHAFIYADSLLDRAITFRDRRLDALRDNRGPVTLTAAPRFVAHVVPLQSLTARLSLPVDHLLPLGNRLRLARPFGHELCEAMPNYEGIVCPSQPAPSGGAPAYAQLFRDGCLEFVGGRAVEGTPTPTAPVMVAEMAFLRHDYPAIYQTMEALQIVPPVLIFVSWMHGARFAVRLPVDVTRGAYRDYALEAHLTRLVGPPVYLDSFAPTLEANGMPARLARMRPAFDVVWNAAGRPGSETIAGSA